MEGRACHGHAGLRQSGQGLTRTDGGQSGPNIRSRRDDQHLAGHQERQCRAVHGRQCRRGASLRLQVGDRSQDREPGQAGGGRPALHPHRVGRRPLCPDPSRHGHRLPERPDPLPAGEGRDPARVCAGLHQCQPDREGGLRLRGRLVHRLRRAGPRLRQVELGLRARRAGLRQDRRHVAASALRDQPAAQARRALHAGDGVAHLRHAAGQIPRGLRADRDHRGARQGLGQPVCAGLDAAFGGFAEHPHHGDGPAPAGQYRRGRRRHECIARPFQHPGPDRCRPPVGPDPRLSDAAEGRRDDLRGIHADAAVQAAASRPDELLAELSEVHRQLPEGDLRRRRARRQRLGL